MTFLLTKLLAVTGTTQNTRMYFHPPQALCFCETKAFIHLLFYFIHALYHPVSTQNPPPDPFISGILGQTQSHEENHFRRNTNVHSSLFFFDFLLLFFLR